ncbi:MAG TPA: alanine/glycine:cation symporter family protein [Sphingobacterium sp.]|nr:alanine/glycine:cation symporter family protein [Sphingobacterium sp.]
MEQILNEFKDVLWDYCLIFLCLGVGVYFSIRTGFLQITYLKEMLRLIFRRQSSDKGISSFQAFALSISGRVGTGNIVGVATAIAYGGPGAVFWMWLIAFLGASSAFVEATLAQVYKKEINGAYRGGPAYYIEKGLGVRWYALLFAVITIIAAGVLLPGVQSNSIAESANNAFNIPQYVVGIFVIVLLGLIIFGGVKRIARAAELVVPFMAGAYILVALSILILNYKEIPIMLKLIVDSAISTDATFGGIVGYAISWGVRRSIYTNEAGQGTAPHPAAAAEVSHPVQQGLVQGFSVYIDTLFVCTATALMILFSGQYNVQIEGQAGYVVENVPGLEATGFTQAAVSHEFPGFGDSFIAIALFFFAFTTILAYYYYAETNVAYLFQKKESTTVVFALRILFLGAVLFGAVKSADLAWTIGDVGVALMALTNLIAITLLSKTAIKVWKDYKDKRKKGEKEPKFVAEKVGIKNTDLWK